MFCSKCGNAVPDGAKFCTSCGSPMAAGGGQAPRAPKEKQAGKPRIRPIVWIIAAAVLIVAAACAFALPKLGSMAAGNAYMFIEREDGYFLTDTNGSLFEIDENAEYNANYTESSGNTVMVELLPDGADERTEGEIYLLSGGQQTKVADDALHLYAVAVEKTVWYLSDYDEDADTATLYRWQNGNRERIETGVLTEGIAVSPDGKTVAYTHAVRGDTFAGCVRTGDKVMLLDEEDIPIAVGNGGKILYYSGAENKGERTVYVRKGDDTQTLFTYDTGALGIFMTFNRDMTQALYDNDGKTYLSVNGEKGQKLANDELSLILRPDDRTHVYGLYSLFAGDIGWFSCAPVRTFAGQVLRVYEDRSYTLYQIEKDDRSYEAERLVSGADDYDIAVDNDTLVYVKKDRIYRMRGFDDAEEIGDAENVQHIWTTDDGKITYYMDADDTLYSVRGNAGESTKVADDAAIMGTMPNTGDCLIVAEEDETEGGKLFVSRGGKRATQIEGADGVKLIDDNHVCMYVYMDYDEDTSLLNLYSFDGKKLKKIVTDLVW